MEIIAKYYNASLNVAVANWREVYLLPDTRLLVEYQAGQIRYREPGSTSRFSYGQLKKGLIRKQVVIKEYSPFLKLNPCRQEQSTVSFSSLLK